MMPVPSVLFVLPAAGASGGANSVVQEATGLSRLGVKVGIAVNDRNYDVFTSNYPDLERRHMRARRFRDTDDLAAAIEDFDIVVATVNSSIFDIADAKAALLAKHPEREVRVAYYVQDYEPLFYEPDSEDWRRAHASYRKIDGAVPFAKTRWLQEIVYENHGVHVAKVSPSIDHEIYYPDLLRSHRGLNVVAMLRPKTPRRAPRRTVRVLETLAGMLKDTDAVFSVFGTNQADLDAQGIQLSERIRNRGQLKRHEVPALMRETDLFLDLSDYQAFGRTGLEGMACGAIPVVPVLGGTCEYAVHGHNAYVVDTRSDAEIISAVGHFVAQSEKERAGMRLNALQTAAEFTVHKAALSELAVFSKMM